MIRKLDLAGPRIEESLKSVLERPKTIVSIDSTLR
jgi:hypothetical protein